HLSQQGVNGPKEPRAARHRDASVQKVFRPRSVDLDSRVRGIRGIDDVTAPQAGDLADRQPGLAGQEHDGFVAGRITRELLAPDEQPPDLAVRQDTELLRPPVWPAPL